MSIASEFKEFAIKSTVVDLAVGVIIAPSPPPRQEVLLEEIRDLLAKRT